MEKKIYSRPYAAEECFTPNQYVAACAVEPVIPSGMDRNHFYIDGLDTGSGEHRHGEDRKCAASTEHVSQLKTLDNPAMQGGGLAQFIENYPHYHIDQGYYDLTTSNACNGQYYTNGSYFSPVVILHGMGTNGKKQYYFLASGPKTSDDPWAYVAPSMKNQS